MLALPALSALTAPAWNLRPPAPNCTGVVSPHLSSSSSGNPNTIVVIRAR